MSFKPMFNFGPNESQGNALRFATYDEAENNAIEKFRAWSMPTGYFVEESTDPVNYTWDEMNSTKSI